MGHNIDLTEFGMCAIRCSCGAELDLTEVDMDCDIKSNNPMKFKLSYQCSDCDKEGEIKFRIVEEKENGR